MLAAAPGDSSQQHTAGLWRELGCSLQPGAPAHLLPNGGYGVGSRKRSGGGRCVQRLWLQLRAGTRADAGVRSACGCGISGCATAPAAASRLVRPDGSRRRMRLQATVEPAQAHAESGAAGAAVKGVGAAARAAPLIVTVAQLRLRPAHRLQGLPSGSGLGTRSAQRRFRLGAGAKGAALAGRGRLRGPATATSTAVGPAGSQPASRALHGLNQQPALFRGGYNSFRVRRRPR